MINFLPEKIKKEIKKEYSFRVVTIFLIIFSMVMVFVSVFLAPAFILSEIRNQSISGQLDMIKKDSSDQTEETINNVKKINEIVKVLSLEVKTQAQVSDLLNTVIKLKSDNIKISSFSSEYDSTQLLKINLKGFSKTRDSVTRYVKDIKNLNLFSSVDLPVSSLIKSSDIDFVISLVFKKE